MRGNRGNIRSRGRGGYSLSSKSRDYPSEPSDHRERERNSRGRGQTHPGPRLLRNQRGTYKHHDSDKLYQDSHRSPNYGQMELPINSPDRRRVQPDSRCYEPQRNQSDLRRSYYCSERSERDDRGRTDNRSRYSEDNYGTPQYRDTPVHRQSSMDYPVYDSFKRNQCGSLNSGDYSPDIQRKQYSPNDRCPSPISHGYRFNSPDTQRRHCSYGQRDRKSHRNRSNSPEIDRKQFSSNERYFERQNDRCSSPVSHRYGYNSRVTQSHRNRSNSPEMGRMRYASNEEIQHSHRDRYSHSSRSNNSMTREYSADRSYSNNGDRHHTLDKEINQRSNPLSTFNIYLPNSGANHDTGQSAIPLHSPFQQMQIVPPLVLPQQPSLLHPQLLPTPQSLPGFQSFSIPSRMQMPKKFQHYPSASKQVTNVSLDGSNKSRIDSKDIKGSRDTGDRNRGRGGTTDDIESDPKSTRQHGKGEKKKNFNKESLVFMNFSNGVDEKFDFKNYLAKRTECLSNVSYQIEGYKQIDNNFVVIVACPSKAASTKLIKLFRKTNSSSDIEVLCYVQQNLPKKLSELQNFKIAASSTDEIKKSLKSKQPKTKKQMDGKAKTDPGKNQKTNCIETCVYVVINDSVKRDIAVDFLKKRLGAVSSYTFILAECKIDDDGKNTRVLIKLPSENIANEVIKALEESNDKSPTKIICSLFPISDLCSSNQEKIDLFLGNVKTRSTMYLEKHQEKIELQESRKNNNNTMKQNVSIGQYEKRMEEINANEFKLLELKSQENEYRTFVEKQKEKVTASINEDDLDIILGDQRKTFGIESLRLESALPIYARRTDILQCIRENQVTIIRGETGSGKSTQLVQYIYEEFSERKSIVCTQPRKVACVSLAKRVSEELLLTLGRDVIHKVGTKDISKDEAKIVFMTDHTLLNECLKDPLFSKYSFIIIDEAHERSIYTDVLLGIIKKCLVKRNDIRVIISSATIDIKVFSDYFTKCKTMQIAGRMFPVQVIWLPEEDQVKTLNDYSEAAVDLAVKIHEEEKEGDILVFMTTPLETERCRDKFIKRVDNKNDFKCLVLHGQLTSQEQQEVFEFAPGKRKIVFATNSAETSITIPGVTFVVDIGLAKEKKFDPKRNMNSLCIETISRSSAEQRKGRAGRTAPGKCYRLYTRRTYEEMKPSNTPEILRIHLGQVLLKLLELNIHPKDCDFVESPKPEAIQSAIKLLENLTAMQDGVITERGKWLSKIPFEPLLGTVIKQGSDKGLIYDAIALASLIGTAGSLFYRSGTDEDKRKLDLLKTNFCDPRGDCFTVLNVFKEWMKQPEKKKKIWTLDNGINNKSIQAVHETILETITVLQNDLKIKVEREFHNDENSLETLQKILVHTFIENTAHFMGHRKAGYFIPVLKQQVFLHPSSALLALNIASEWVVYMNLLQTSSDFLLTVTPVKEVWLQELDRETRLPFVIEEVKQTTILNVCSMNFGPVSFSAFVGPRYTKLRKYEEILSERCSSIVKLDADKDLGEVNLFSSNFLPHANDILQEWVKEARSTIANKTSEHKLGTKVCENGGVRIVLGPGGEGSVILMPKEYRSVFISKPNLMTTKERVIEKFSKFGKIIDCFEERNAKNRWGRVEFESSKAAAISVNETKLDSEDVAVPIFKVSEDSSTMFRVRIEWPRRPSKHIAFIGIDGMYLAKANRIGQLNILGSICPIRLDNKTSTSLCVTKLPDHATEKDIYNSLCMVMGLETENEKKIIEEVRLIREKGFQSSENDLKNIKATITAQLSMTFERNSFVVDVMKPKKQSDSKYITIVKFKRPEDGYQCLKEIIKVKGEQVKITPDISSKINISQTVYDIMKDTLSEAIETLNQEPDFELKHHIQVSKKKRVVIHLYSTKPDDLARARYSMEALLKGEVIDCWGNGHYSHLFTRTGMDFARQLETSTGTAIHLDEMRYNITIYGKEERVKSAQTMIDNYLNDIRTRTVRDLNLRADGMPHGLMKALVRKYGITLDSLVAECELSSARLDHKRHLLKLCGESTAIERAESVVWALKDVIGNIQQASIEESHPECCTCFCPVDDVSQLCRLESCGHAYCLECLSGQIAVAIQCKELPILCGTEDCEKPLLWPDFTNIFKKSKIRVENLVQAAVTNFMMKDIHGCYRHCLTPDCPLVYRSSETGELFTCSECNLRICTSCHVEYHDGLSCTMYQRNKIDKMEMEKYLEEHCVSTKRCPSCFVLIEKSHGCNRMECYACKTIFCWLCLEKFDSSSTCYDHLNAIHGGIANEEDLYG